MGIIRRAVERTPIIGFDEARRQSAFTMVSVKPSHPLLPTVCSGRGVDALDARKLLIETAHSVHVRVTRGRIEHDAPF
jgi:hypothetical protein